MELKAVEAVEPMVPSPESLAQIRFVQNFSCAALLVCWYIAMMFMRAEVVINPVVRTTV